MSIDVVSWQSHKQHADVCILTSYGLAASVFSTTAPSELLAPYALSQGMIASAPTTDEQAAACAYANDQQRRRCSGFELLDALHTSGIAPFDKIQSACTVEPFDLAAQGLPALIATLLDEKSVAIVCINIPPNAAHAVALGADPSGALWRNDPNFGLCRLTANDEAAICNGYPARGVGDIRIVRGIVPAP